MCCVPSIFVIIVLPPTVPLLFFYIYIFLSSCYGEKAFLELTFVEIVTPENSHLRWRIARNARSGMSVGLQDGNRMEAVSQGFTIKSY